jgi:excinuclease UvrABC nuclease subunit
MTGIRAHYARQFPATPAVYRFYAGDVCIYAGATNNLRQRIGFHKYFALLERVEFLACDPSELNRLEGEWIDTYKPTLNKRRALYGGQNNNWKLAARLVRPRTGYWRGDAKVAA